MNNSVHDAVLPEYHAENIGAPFKVILCHSVRQKKDLEGKVLETIIPNPKGLLHEISIARLTHSRKLTGKDIKFIRKSLSIKAKNLADMIEISPEHLSRCESGDRILSPTLEKFLRLTVLIDTLNIPNDLERKIVKGKNGENLLNNLKNSLNHLKDVIKDMKIDSAHSLEKELVLYFNICRSEHSCLTDDGDWQANLKAA